MLTAHVVRTADPVAAQIYWGWQVLVGPIFVGLAALLTASRWLAPHARWPGALVAAACVGLLFVLLSIDWIFTTWEVMLWQELSFGSSTDLNVNSWQKVTTLVVASLLGLVSLASACWPAGRTRAGSQSETTAIAEPSTSADRRP